MELADEYRILTVVQPWAWAIIHADKVTENRTTLWKYRGPLLIHAGASWDPRGAMDLRLRTSWADANPDRDRAAAEWDDAVGPPRIPPPRRLTPSILAHPSVIDWPDPAPGRPGIHHSCIIGRADLVDVHESTPACCAGDCSPWGEAQYPDRLTGTTRHAVTHLVLADRRALPHPIPWSGGLGLRKAPADLVEQVVAQLAAA